MGKNYQLYEKAVAKDDDCQLCIVIGEALDQLEKNYPALYAEMVAPIEKLAYCIPKDEAEKIVRNMKPRGQYWSYDDVANFLKDKGITTDIVDYYLVMNMAYNDYYSTAATYGLQKDAEFYFSLAKDFIQDPDAKPHKVSKYFMD